jgi:hypothetical protein
MKGRQILWHAWICLFFSVICSKLWRCYFPPLSHTFTHNIIQRPWTRDTSRSRRVLNCRLQVNSITFRCLAMCGMMYVSLWSRDSEIVNDIFVLWLIFSCCLIWTIRSDTRRRNGRVWGASTVGKRVLTNWRHDAPISRYAQVRRYGDL